MTPEERLAEIHSWIVCAAIASPEDLMQNAERIEALSSPVQKLSDAEIAETAESMPGGVTGYCRTWGYTDLARAVERAIHKKLGIKD